MSIATLPTGDWRAVLVATEGHLRLSARPGRPAELLTDGGPADMWRWVIKELLDGGWEVAIDGATGALLFTPPELIAPDDVARQLD
jgi:hypothetical protein